MSEKDKNERAVTCPYRDEIRDMVKLLPDIKETTDKIFNRLFVDNNGDSLVSEINKNTSFRKECQNKKKYNFMTRWGKYGFWLAFVVFIVGTIINLYTILN